MSSRGRRNFGGSHTNKHTFGRQNKQVLDNLDDSNETIKMFRKFSTELDEKNDRYERIVKNSRDITIESKRIIFLLHSLNKEETKLQIINKATSRLDTLITTNFRNIAKELEGQDEYQYLRAYSAGLQEFIEAYLLCTYLENFKLLHWNEITKRFRYESEGTENKVPLPATEFFLGVCDLTGELMRRCVNNLGVGDVEESFALCQFVRDIYTGFIGIGNSTGIREFNRKMFVLRASLMKMESVCYNVRVRGGEVPPSSLVPVEEDEPTDEGYF